MNNIQQPYSPTSPYMSLTPGNELKHLGYNIRIFLEKWHQPVIASLVIWNLALLIPLGFETGGLIMSFFLMILHIDILLKTYLTNIKDSIVRTLHYVDEHLFSIDKSIKTQSQNFESLQKHNTLKLEGLHLSRQKFQIKTLQFHEYLKETLKELELCIHEVKFNSFHSHIAGNANSKSLHFTRNEVIRLHHRIVELESILTTQSEKLDELKIEKDKSLNISKAVNRSPYNKFTPLIRYDIPNDNFPAPDHEPVIESYDCILLDKEIELEKEEREEGEQILSPLDLARLASKDLDRPNLSRKTNY